MSNNTTHDEIIAAADDLFYRQGYEHTSFADIANVVKISRGNFYHHFKSKDEILDAVIGKRLADRQAMLQRWEIEGATPEDRIRSFIGILIVNGKKIERYGCPIGTLTSELAKLNHVAQGEANKLFALFRAWLRQQFVALGREDDADTLAMHLLARSQGVATLSNAFQDKEFVRQEVEQMHDWLKSCVPDSTARKRKRAGS